MKKATVNKQLKPTTQSGAKILNCNVEFKLSGEKDANGDLIIKGFANTVTKDRVDESVLPKAFEKTLPTFMENPVLLFQHDWDKVIGKVTEAKITEKGLFITAKISQAADVKDIRTKINEGILSTFSIGYNEIDSDFEKSTDTKIINELELLEISVVTIPANVEAKFRPVQEGDAEKDEKSAAEKEVFSKDVRRLAEVVSDLVSVIETKEGATMDKDLKAEEPKTDVVAEPEMTEEQPKAESGDDVMKGLSEIKDALTKLTEAVVKLVEVKTTEDEEEKVAKEEDEDKPKEEEEDKDEDMKSDSKEEDEDMDDEEDEEKALDEMTEEEVEKELEKTVSELEEFEAA